MIIKPWEKNYNFLRKDMGYTRKERTRRLQEIRREYNRFNKRGRLI